MENWTLTLTLSSDRGKKFDYCLNANEFVFDRLVTILPPSKDPFERILNGETLEGVVEKIRKRELRKDLLRHESTRLGILLAEYMEDKEGWHGIDRQERIEQRENKIARTKGSASDE